MILKILKQKKGVLIWKIINYSYISICRVVLNNGKISSNNNIQK